MPITCRLIEIKPDLAASLVEDPNGLENAVASARIYTDVYRYWHGIEHLLALTRPTMPAARWLGLGQAVSAASGDVPAARVLSAAEVTELAAVVRDVEPEALAPHYDAEALDAAGIYPRTWMDWEETFDPLGQLLEHYSFLQRFAQKCADAGDALLLRFGFIDDGSDA